MSKRPPVIPTKSNDPKGERPSPLARPPDPPALAELRAKLEILREYGVAAYQRDAEGRETINLYPAPARPPTAGELAKEEDRREDSQEAWERRMRFGAAGGMRGAQR